MTTDRVGQSGPSNSPAGTKVDNMIDKTPCSMLLQENQLTLQLATEPSKACFFD